MVNEKLCLVETIVTMVMLLPSHSRHLLDLTVKFIFMIKMDVNFCNSGQDSVSHDRLKKLLLLWLPH